MSHSRSHSALTAGGAARSPSRQRSPSSPPSLPLLPQGPEALVLPEGLVGEEAAELLHEFVHPHHSEGESLIGDVERDGQQRAVENPKLPWWKRPSPWWFLAGIPVSSIAVSAMMAPRIEIYTRLACEVYSPNTTIPEGMEPGTMLLTSILRDRVASMIPSDSGGDLEDLCASDPVVQAAAAQLNMIYTTCMGILACLTTAAWGSLSDRYGRTRVLGIAIFGLLFTDINFISVTKFRKSLPGGYWFFIVGALVEGGLGGMATASAGIHAYIADCTDAHTRSRFFSLFLGLLFCGFALGPTVGGLLVRYTGDLLVPFYFATCMHTFYGLALWFVVPESLTPKQMIEARNSHATKVEQQRLVDARPFLSGFNMLFTALSPLKLFLSPPLRKDSKPGKPKRDWNLLFIALSYGGTIMLMGSYNYKFQYLSATFGWKSEQIGYWLSIVGFTRALYLTAILPVVIKLFKPKPIQLPIEPSEPLQPENTESTGIEDSASPPSHQLQSLSFDLGLARFALVIDIVSYILLPLAPNALLFTAYTMMGCLGTGFSPAVQSVAMGLYTQQGGTELGKLFGALSVMSALCSQILGPALFGLTYMKTAGTMPTAMFYLAGLAVTFSFICLSFVRLPKEMEVIEDEEERSLEGASLEMVREETLVDTEIPVILVEEDRGGKRSDS